MYARVNLPPPIIIGPLSKDIKTIKSEREGHLSAVVKDTKRDFLTVCKVAKNVG